MSIFYTTSDNRDNKNSGIVHKGGNKYPGNLTVDVLNGPINTELFKTGPVEEINTTTSKFLSVFAKNTQRGLIKTLVNNELESDVSAVIKTAGNTNINNVTMVHDISFTTSRLQLTAFRTGKYRFFTGKYDVGYPDTRSDYFGIDTSVTKNRENQGKVFFKGGKDITITSYQSKTG